MSTYIYRYYFIIFAKIEILLYNNIILDFIQFIMPHLTSNKEIINFSGEPPKFEKDLLYLQSDIELTQLKNDIEKGKP